MKKLSAVLTMSALLFSTSVATVANAAKASVVSMTQILSVVSKTYSGEVTKIELDVDDASNLYYEVEILNESTKIELTLDAKTGKIVHEYETRQTDDEQFYIKNYAQNNNPKTVMTPSVTPKPTIDTTTGATPKSKTTQNVTVSMISEEKAKQTALDKVGGGKVVKCKLDYDDHLVKYEVKILYNNTVYELEIDAKTGKVVDYETEYTHH